MIKSKDDLQFYLEADKFALDKKYSKPKINDDVWKFQILLRKVEYYKNKNPSLLSIIYFRFTVFFI